ncbi:MAG: hypothetical protein ACM3X9_12910 [Bacillota bacterium]
MKCPDCATHNQSFVEYCQKCGADLYKLRHEKAGYYRRKNKSNSI